MAKKTKQIVGNVEPTVEKIAINSLGELFSPQVLKRLNQFPHKTLDITNGTTFPSHEFYDMYFPVLYYYNNYKIIPQEYLVNVNIPILDYFLINKARFSIIKSCYNPVDGLSNITFHETKTDYIYQLASEFFDDVAGFTMRVFGQKLDYAKLNKEFNLFNIENNVDDSVFQIGMVKSGQFGLDIGWFDVPKPEVNIDLNYGSEFFVKHYPAIVNKLNTTFKGVYLFDGDPGTGKTFFIKHLASTIKNRDFIYLSDSVIGGGLDNPGLIELLAQHKNCVLVIEDAEKYITSRKDDPNSFVANLLNLADGILSDLFGYSIILTHNMDNIENIDSALKRKGRLQYQYQFGKLTVSDAQRKIDSLGIKHKVEEKMTLAEIYNLNVEIGPESKKEHRMIGFGQ